MPPLQLVLMLQKITEEEGAFWHGLDLETQEELELGALPPNIQLVDMSWQI